MNNLSKEKKQQLILVCVVTVMVLAGLWFGLINWQQKSRANIEKKARELAEKVVSAENTMKRADAINREMEKNKRELQAREETLPSAKEAYSWLITVMNKYVYPRQLANFNVPSAPTQPHDVAVIPKFPYKAVSIRVELSAYYQDFGKFLADFENDWPFLRVQNLVITPAATAPGDEKLNFQFEVVTLALTNRVGTTMK